MQYTYVLYYTIEYYDVAVGNSILECANIRIKMDYAQNLRKVHGNLYTIQVAFKKLEQGLFAHKRQAKDSTDAYKVNESHGSHLHKSFSYQQRLITGCPIPNFYSRDFVFSLYLTFILILCKLFLCISGKIQFLIPQT